MINCDHSKISLRTQWVNPFTTNKRDFEKDNSHDAMMKIWNFMLKFTEPELELNFQRNYAISYIEIDMLET